MCVRVFVCVWVSVCEWVCRLQGNMERESGRSTRRSLPVVPNRNVSQLGHLVSHHDLDLYYIRQIAGHLKVNTRILLSSPVPTLTRPDWRELNLGFGRRFWFNIYLEDISIMPKESLEKKKLRSEVLGPTPTWRITLKTTKKIQPIELRVLQDSLQVVVGWKLSHVVFRSIS